MIDIENAKNIGPITGAELRSIGVRTLHDLQAMGVEEAFYQIIEQHPERLNLNFLLALVGACENCDWREILGDKKESLKDFLAKTKKQLEKELL